MQSDDIFKLREVFGQLSLPDGWQHCAQDEAAGLERELQREVGPGHPLQGRRVLAAARATGSDDVVFLVDGEPPFGAIVHLTWSGHQERQGWPRIRKFDSLNALVDGMSDTE